MGFQDYFNKKEIGMSRVPRYYVAPENLEQFLTHFVRDTSIDSQIRAIIVCAISSGLGLKDALKLSIGNFSDYQFSLPREFTIHPAARDFFSGYARNKKGPLFDYSKDGVQKALRRIFNIPGIGGKTWQRTHEEFIQWRISQVRKNPW